MNKADLIAALGVINDKELVLLRLSDGTILSVESVDIQQDEAPIFGIVVTADITKGEFQQIADERLQAKERELLAEEQRVSAVAADDAAFAARVKAVK